MSDHPDPVALSTLQQLHHVRTDALDIGYYEAGSTADPVVLLHGFPYDIHSYVDVIPCLVASGRRVIVPYLRGHGPTNFLDSSSARSGQIRRPRI